MTELEIRDMTAADIDAAVRLYRSGGWDHERPFQERILAIPICQPLVGVCDGAIVATGLAAINGPVGWVGSIFVDPSQRRRGLGRAMTDAVCARIDAAGCSTQALIASEYGRPIYERMGFRIDTWYQMLEALPLHAAPTPPRGATLRQMRPDDIDRVGELDRRATGEDRRGLLGPLSADGWLLEAGDELLGFMIPIEPRCAAVVAPDPQDGSCLLDLMRHLGRGRAKTVRAALVKEDEDGQLFLEQRGWGRTFEAPRMLRGSSIDREPALVWSLLGFAFG
jgi:GNAT superfamily N-acetyltransferase